jgi:hypothetical protein
MAQGLKALLYLVQWRRKSGLRFDACHPAYPLRPSIPILHLACLGLQSAYYSSSLGAHASPSSYVGPVWYGNRPLLPNNWGRGAY